MEIHIGNLPPQATVSDLNNLFRLPANPSQCRVFKKQGKDGRVFHYGLAIIRPDAAAQRLIERYRNASLDGKRLEVREFQARRIANERRALNWRTKPWNGGERRKLERRAA
jgi:RNA recognition motif-containing protein